MSLLEISPLDEALVEALQNEEKEFVFMRCYRNQIYTLLLLSREIQM